jgi:hypothetical protein
MVMVGAEAFNEISVGVRFARDLMLLRARRDWHN